MITPYLVAGGVAVVLAVGGAFATPLGPWYRNLRKPSWQPPDWLFGPAWTLILALWAWAGGYAWSHAPDDAARVDVLILFGVNALCHAAWSPLFFRWRRPDWALVEVVFLWASLIALVAGLAPFAPMASLAIVPYLLWVSFAAWLNYTIVRLNGPFAGV